MHQDRKIRYKQVEALPNSSSNAMTTSTTSKLSSPRSFMKCASGVTYKGDWINFEIQSPYKVRKILNQCETIAIHNFEFKPQSTDLPCVGILSQLFVLTCSMV